MQTRPFPLLPRLSNLLDSTGARKGRAVRPDQRARLDLPPQTCVPHPCCGRLEVGGCADGGEVNLFVLVGKGREGEGEREGRGEYGFQVRFLQADVEEPEVLIKLDLGRHDMRTS